MTQSTMDARVANADRDAIKPFSVHVADADLALGAADLGVLGIAAVVLWFLRDDSSASTNEPTSYREAA